MKLSVQQLSDLKQRFFSDPQWTLMETLIRDYIDPLTDMNSIDVTQPAEHVKAEIIGRRLAYDRLDKFLRDSQIVKGRALPETKTNEYQ